MRLLEPPCPFLRLLTLTTDNANQRAISGKEVEETVGTTKAQVDEEEELKTEKEYHCSIDKDDSFNYGNLLMDITRMTTCLTG